MNSIEQIIYLYEANKNAMRHAIVEAGGTPGVVEQENFISVLILLSQNNIKLDAKYLGEER